MYHHDSRPYAAAKSEAATHMRDKLESLIGTGKASATALLEKVQTEVPVDRIATAGALEFLPGAPFLGLQVAGAGDDPEELGLVKHSLMQACERLGMRQGAAADLLEMQRTEKAPDEDTPPDQWANRLLAHNLNELREHRGQRYLLREHDGEVRGFLSDRFRRLDSRPIVDAFCAEAGKIGAVPYEGVFTDTRICLRAILPTVFEPVPGELMGLGLSLTNSDYGNGRLALQAWMMRMWCTNKATTTDVLAQVHLGGQLPANIQLSEQTYQLDTGRTVSLLSDCVRGALGDDRVAAICEGIKEAAETEMPEQSIQAALKRTLGKGELETTVAKFRSADVELLPAGQNAWRLSNAVSWLAGETPDVDRRLELERFAGKLAGFGDKAKAKVPATASV